MLSRTCQHSVLQTATSQVFTNQAITYKSADCALLMSVIDDISSLFYSCMLAIVARTWRYVDEIKCGTQPYVDQPV